MAKHMPEPCEIKIRWCDHIIKNRRDGIWRFRNPIYKREPMSVIKESTVEDWKKCPICLARRPIYTPGPWKIGKNNCLIVSCHPSMCDRLKGSNDMEYYGGYCIAESSTEADARLIVTSPTLYEFVQDLANNGNKKAKMMLDSLGLAEGIGDK